MDKNKSAYKLEGMPPIYYVNLDGQPERKDYMELSLHTGELTSTNVSLDMMVEMTT